MSSKEATFSEDRNSLLRQILLLAFLYCLTGALGLMLAVPPGYATIAWPPAGIAVGMLVIYGWRLWPGILLGSFLVNTYTAGALDAQASELSNICLTAFGIGFGSTLQALSAWYLTKRIIGIPITLRNPLDLLKTFLTLGPIPCLIAPTVGVSMLLINGVIESPLFLDNWTTWWTGDLIGVAVFTPLVLMAFKGEHRIYWNGKALKNLPLLAVLLIVTSLSATFYAWKVSSEIHFEDKTTEFEELVSENRKALSERLKLYRNALLSAKGYISGSDSVSHTEWRRFADALNLKKNYLGMNGIGWIDYVEPTKVESYLVKTQSENREDFRIHPDTEGKPLYVITYIEPESANLQAIGLNIAFEASREAAANLSRDTGEMALTKPITLVQDFEKTPGFLLLQAVYKQGAQISTVEQRREALLDWTYSPLIARDFLSNLTESEGRSINLSVYQGTEEDESKLIFSTKEDRRTVLKPQFKQTASITIMQEQWFLVWESALPFEHQAAALTPLLILVGGCALSGLFALFLISQFLHQEDTMLWMKEEQRLTLAGVIILISTLLSFSLYVNLLDKESERIDVAILREAEVQETRLVSSVEEKLRALYRMAERWNSSNRTERSQWTRDARNYVAQFPALRALEWVDTSYHIRWVEPLVGNEKAVGLNIVFNEEREKALTGAAERNSPTVTAPISLVQGYDGFLVYHPLKYNEAFDGFLAAVVSIADIFSLNVDKGFSHNFVLSASFDGKEYYRSFSNSPALSERSASAKINIYDKEWEITIYPTRSFLERQQSYLPITVLVSGIVIGILLAFASHFVLVAKVKSERLIRSAREMEANQNEKARLISIIEESTDFIGVYELDGTLLYHNSSAKKMLGLSKDEDISELKNEDIYTQPALQTYKQESLPSVLTTGSWQGSSELRHRDGHVIPVSQVLTLHRDAQGEAVCVTTTMRDMSEWFLAQEELEAKERLMREFVTSTPAAVAMFDREMRYLAFSKRWVEDYKLGEQDLTGQKHYDIFPDLPDRYKEHHRLILSGEEEMLAEEDCFERENGDKVWINWELRPWMDAHGEIAGMMMFTEITTERRLAEEARAKANQIYKLLVTNVKDYAIYSIDTEGNVLTWNGGAERMKGYTVEEVLGQPFSMFWSTEIRKEKTIAQCLEEARTKGSYEAEEQHVRKDGSHFWASVSFTPIMTQDSTLIGYSVVIHDFTRRKESDRRLAEERQKLQQALDEVSFYRDAMDEHAIVAMTDRTGRITHVNSLFSEVSGYSADEIIGHTHSMLNSGVHSREFFAEMWSTISSGKTWKGELCNRNKEGDRYWVNATIVPQLDANGTPLNYLALRTDVTPIKKLVEELSEARIKIERAMESRSRFLANMSHEIRTPLNSIIGYSETLLQDSMDKDTASECIQTIMSNGEHLLGIINDVLDFTKIEAGKLSVEMLPLSVSDLISDVMNVMRYDALDKGLTLDFTTSSSVPPWIESDPMRLKQILINLVGNAVKFTSTGGVRLEVDYQSNSNRLSFSVVDTGLGMNESQIAGLFNAFEQGDTSTTRSFGGTGLGLAISKELAAKLGGDIEVQSTLGKGSRFTVNVLAASVKAPSAQEKKHALLLHSKEQQSEVIANLCGKVLIAEDGEDNRKLLELLLNKTKINYTFVPNGKLAVQAALAEPFDLILMDAQMPVMDGYTATKLLRSNQVEVPIMALTANALQADIDHAYNMGATDFLGKPFRRDELFAKIAQYVGNTKQIKETAVLTDFTCDMLDDSPELVELVRSIIKRMPERYQTLEEALAGEDLEHTIRLIHNIRGASANIGFSDIAEAAFDIEERLKAGNLEGIEEPMAALKQCIDASLELDQEIVKFSESG